MKQFKYMMMAAALVCGLATLLAADRRVSVKAINLLPRLRLKQKIRLRLK